MGAGIVEALQQGAVLADGGHAEEARTRGYGTPRVVTEFPNVVRLIHRDYYRAGAQLLRAQTARIRRGNLMSGDSGARHIEDLSRAAVRLAKAEAAGEGPGGAFGQALVAGCIGAARGTDLSGTAAREQAWADWEEQIAVMADEGVDLLYVDSFATLRGAQLALACSEQAGLPVVVTLDLPVGAAATDDGVGPAECARTLAGEGATVVGLGGTREPRDMWPAARAMRESVDVPVAFLPSGYRTSVPNWQATRESMIIAGHEMARYALQAKAHGIHLIGGSDGAGPELIRFMAQALDCERVHVDLHRR